MKRSKRTGSSVDIPQLPLYLLCNENKHHQKCCLPFAHECIDTNNAFKTHNEFGTVPKYLQHRALLQAQEHQYV
eukprot:TRINITY_DN33968_c0_g1_i1.p1 TRINITY_DN33968_c0_g1~~TRINITY_DN33968_c0_g1_i1.p1  ORF type:complete len:74 (-),score=3.04 TRINITY_DN33968_c0_g1_i1:178-399(-)